MVQNTPSRKLDQYIVRMPDGLRGRIAAAAKANNRSMNAEIVATLEDAYPPEPTIEDLIYWANMLANDFVDAPEYSHLRNLKDALKDLVTQLQKGQREGYPKTEREVFRDELIAQGKLDPVTHEWVKESNEPSKPKSRKITVRNEGGGSGGVLDRRDAGKFLQNRKPDPA